MGGVPPAREKEARRGCRKGCVGLQSGGGARRLRDDDGLGVGEKNSSGDVSCGMRRKKYVSFLWQIKPQQTPETLVSKIK